MNNSYRSEEGSSSNVGIVLLVALAVVLSVIVIGVSTGFFNEQNAEMAGATSDFTVGNQKPLSIRIA